MKRKIDFRIVVIIILISIVTIMCYSYFKEDAQIPDNVQKSRNNINFENYSNEETSTIIVQTTSEIKSSLTENIQLHATYYLEESYVEVNQGIKAGENILKYTNGTYLVAPYDCIITKINIPGLEEKCTNEHYIEISSKNSLEVELKVDQTKINKLSLGQEAKIEIEALDNKEVVGNITNISNTASNGNFTVKVEFENDGQIMLGMTASVIIE